MPPLPTPTFYLVDIWQLQNWQTFNLLLLLSVFV